MIQPINSNDPFYIAYKDQRHNAARRRIRWEFDFLEWKALWESSGKWHQRGKGRDKYCMSRFNDEGPYAADNVEIITNGENLRQSHDRCRFYKRAAYEVAA